MFSDGLEDYDVASSITASGQCVGAIEGGRRVSYTSSPRQLGTRIRKVHLIWH